MARLPPNTHAHTAVHTSKAGPTPLFMWPWTNLMHSSEQRRSGPRGLWWLWHFQCLRLMNVNEGSHMGPCLPGKRMVKCNQLRVSETSAIKTCFFTEQLNIMLSCRKIFYRLHRVVYEWSFEKFQRISKKRSIYVLCAMISKDFNTEAVCDCFQSARSSSSKGVLFRVKFRVKTWFTRSCSSTD